MVDDFFVTDADFVKNLLGPFMLVGQHGDREPFMADCAEDLPAGTFGIGFKTVFCTETFADGGHIGIAFLVKSTLFCYRTVGVEFSIHKKSAPLQCFRFCSIKAIYLSRINRGSSMTEIFHF